MGILSWPMDAKNLYLTSLGCSKNLVDAQVMLGSLKERDYQVVGEPELADVIVVNTCSFIDSAQEESVNTILELADYKQRGRCRFLVVSGCLPQRYALELEELLPEVDVFIGTGEYYKIGSLLEVLEEGSLEKKTFVDIPKFIHTEMDARINTSPPYTAWLKVSEGCNRNCTFCIIPSLRGKLRSRTVASLAKEARKLVSSGVRELNIISQDLSDFGSDTKESLFDLVVELDNVRGVDWVRLFYYYPEDMDERVMDVMAWSKKICPYLDMPVQHFSSKILRKMNRKADAQIIRNKIAVLRKKVPGIVLRTSVIVGFPGESEEDFEQLLAGVQSCRFHHLGVFRYSDQKGAPSYRLQDKVPADIIERRYQKVYEVQKSIVREMGEEYVGKVIPVLVEGAHHETPHLLKGRHSGQAPDIDGCVVINSGAARSGEIVPVEITDVLDYDLLGRIV